MDKQQFLDALQTLNKHREGLSTEQIVNLLRTTLLYADRQYYIKDNPVLADAEYDQLFAELKSLEQEEPELIHPGSPTQRVALGRSVQFEPSRHIVPMLSLENSYNEEDLRDWDKRLRATLGGTNVQYSVEPKYDGAGISLMYEGDHLAVAATRGDGIVGENITPNARQIRTIPLHADFMRDGVEQIEIRGEVVIRKSTFKAFNQQRVEDGLPPLANPRNAASGTLRILDPEEVKKRGLYAILYHISYHSDIADPSHPLLQGHFESLQWLSRHGFATPIEEMHLCATIDEVIGWCREYEKKRDEMPYEIDGMVVKVNLYDIQERLGMTSHHPRWAIAYKFKARQGTSRLRDVEFQVGRTGMITPVAKIEPVSIGGVTISSISLFNEDIIREKNLMLGDTVLVERAGDVIPYIVKSVEELRTGNEVPIEFPRNCPVCNTELFKAIGEVAWRCVNINCQAQVVERMIHFVSKDAMDIRSLGEANVRRFYQLGFLKSVEDIYQLPYDQLSGLDKLGQKSIENLGSAIEKSKSQPLNRLIFALGIRFVGEATAKTLARNIHHILDLKDKTIEDLCRLEDIGPKVASSIHEYFSNEDNMTTLQRLGSMGVALEKPLTSHNTPEGSLELAGQTFLFTGTLAQLKRSDAEAMVEARGGKILSGVSSKLNYLVVGADAGSKLDKAKKLGNVHILTEQEFLDRMN